MIKIKDIVEETIKKDREALLCLSRGILNLSSYARSIHQTVEEKTKKQVEESTIVMALSRLRPYIKDTGVLVEDITIDGLTIKTPLCEIVYEKTEQNIAKLSSLEKKFNRKSDEWFIFTQNTNSIIILCSERLVTILRKHIDDKPILLMGGLAAVGLSLSKDYHSKPNVIFSILNKIAYKNIPLTEVLSTWGEVILVFKLEKLSQIVDLFQNN